MLSNGVIYEYNKSSVNDLFIHLSAVDNDYAVRLSDRTDIKEYAQKLFEKSARIEAWDSDVLVGLVAYYNNQATNSIYVSNVSVKNEFRSYGIASNLLDILKDNVIKNNITKIVLEADDSIIDFYEKNGFTIGKQISDRSHEMEYYKDDKDIMVSICCLVYNHEPYLRQCFDGFVMQKTNFPIEILVHDDASTDHSADIIREYTEKYPDLFKPIYQKENQYSKGVKITMTYQIPRAKGKYIAMCEGDDYWTDPHKLQKQVDFLEGHDDYVMCAHNSIVKDESTGIMRCFNNWLQEDTYGYSDIISKNWFIPTQSMLFRKDIYDANKMDRHFYNGDYYLQLCLTRDGGLVHYSNECMSVYRKGVGISKGDTSYKNNLRLIDLLEYMSALSDEKYKKVFDDKIATLKQCNVKIDLEERNINSIWYKIRYKLLVLFIKILRFKNPGVGIKIIH